MAACLRRRTSGAAGGVCAQRIARVAHYDGGMELRVNGALIHYVEHGRGVPLVALHGAGVDHREIEAALEAIVPGPGYRRIYPDLPGMGRSPAGDLDCNDGVVALLAAFIDQLEVGPVILLGHSYGAYLARGLAAQRPEIVLALALLCPVAERSQHVPEHQVIRQDPGAYDELEPGQRQGFDEYFVVRSQATARRYRNHVVPGTRLCDEAGLGRIFAGWRVDVGSGRCLAPALIVAGRCDSIVGYSDATELLEGYPHATLAVLDGAGHALMHERPEPLAALVRDWLDRTRSEDR